MIKENLIKKAEEFAQNRHAGQMYGKQPDYMFHLYSVFNIVSEYSKDENVLAASLLHDILEDTETKYEEIYDGFGEYVADLVFHLSDPPGKNRKERKELLYKRFEELDQYSFKAKVALIKCSDRYLNMVYSYITSDIGKMSMYIKEHKQFEYHFVNALSAETYTLAKRISNIVNNINSKLEVKK